MDTYPIEAVNYQADTYLTMEDLPQSMQGTYKTNLRPYLKSKILGCLGFCLGAIVIGYFGHFIKEALLFCLIVAVIVTIVSVINCSQAVSMSRKTDNVFLPCYVIAKTIIREERKVYGGRNREEEPDATEIVIFYRVTFGLANDTFTCNMEKSSFDILTEDSMCMLLCSQDTVHAFTIVKYEDIVHNANYPRLDMKAYYDAWDAVLIRRQEQQKQKEEILSDTEKLAKSLMDTFHLPRFMEGSARKLSNVILKIVSDFLSGRYNS